MMKKYLAIIIITIGLFSCNNKSKIPDVSGVKIDLEVKRFEQDFFKIDTNNISQALQVILQKYPRFTPDFMYNILGIDLDSLELPGNNNEKQNLLSFIRDYSTVKDSAELLFRNFDETANSIKKGLQFVKYYFPQYAVPHAIITYIGPLNANFQTSFGTQSDVLTTEGLGIGLQLHMGSEFSLYKSPMGQEIYPNYISANFGPKQISVNCIRNIVDDLYPSKSMSNPLVERMVEKGKRLFLLSKFLPETPENLLLGYTETQMKDSYSHEALIWEFFLSNNLLSNSEENQIKNYLGESPKTPELGENAPGNLGSFSGWQIVKKYMDKYPDTKLDDLMKMSPRDVYSLSKYKPRD